MRQRRQAASGLVKCLLRVCYRAMTIKTKLIENYYFSTQGFLITEIYIKSDFTFGFYGQVSSAGNSRVEPGSFPPGAPTDPDVPN